MLGRTPGNIVAIKPMKDGVIADFKVTEKMLNYFIQKAHNRKMLVHPRIVKSACPRKSRRWKRRWRPWTPPIARRRARSTSSKKRWRRPLAPGMPITEASGNMVVDIGGGTTDIAVISLAGVVYGQSVRVAGNELDEAIMLHARKAHNLLIGERTAEQIKIEIGSALSARPASTMESQRPHLMEGVPEDRDDERRGSSEGAQRAVRAIVQAVHDALERTPPELSADISDRGIILTGGGALLKNLDKRSARRNRPAGVARRDPVVVRRPRHWKCLATSNSCARFQSSNVAILNLRRLG